MKPTRIIEKNIDLWNQVPQMSKQHPWYNPPEVDYEMQMLADAIDGGGHITIREVENG